MENLAVLVDDDQHSLFFFEHLLRPTGMHILTAQDGAQAIELLSRHTPSIIFLDLLLPRVNGLAVLEYIQASPVLDRTQVIIVSAQNPARFTDSSALSRVDTFLVKPVRFKEVRALADAARQEALVNG